MFKLILIVFQSCKFKWNMSPRKATMEGEKIEERLLDTGAGVSQEGKDGGREAWANHEAQ